MAETLKNILSISQFTLRNTADGLAIHFHVSVLKKPHEPLKFVLAFDHVPAATLQHATEMMDTFEGFLLPWISGFCRSESAIDMQAIMRFREQLPAFFLQEELADWPFKDMTLNGGTLATAHLWDLVFYIKKLVATKAAASGSPTCLPVAA